MYTKSPPLIEPPYHILMGLSAITGVDILRKPTKIGNYTDISTVYAIQNSVQLVSTGSLHVLTMVIVYSCLREFIVLRRRTTTPSPSTVSIVRARRLGVSASKSCKNQSVASNTESLSTRLYSNLVL